MRRPPLSLVDYTRIRASQAMAAYLLISAYVIESWPLVAAVAAAHLLGALVPALSPFGLVYAGLIWPLRLLRPHMVPDRTEPHHFAQFLSTVVTGVGAGLVAAGVGAGWAVVWLVIILAGLNTFAGFCAGCFTYYRLARLGLTWFWSSRTSSRRGA